MSGRSSAERKDRSHGAVRFSDASGLRRSRQLGKSFELESFSVRTFESKVLNWKLSPYLDSVFQFRFSKKKCMCSKLEQNIKLISFC